jgi:hypothetical protein
MPTPPRRRWFRFRLRTLFIVVAVIAIPLAWIAKERGISRRENQLVEQNDEIRYTLGGPFDSWDRHATKQPQGWWRDLARRLVGTRILFLWASPNDLKDLEPVVELTNLRALSLLDATVSDFTPLAKCKHLRILDLDSTKVRDLSPLAGLVNLELIDLGNTQVSDLAPLSGLINLESLDLRETPVSDLTPLASLKNLKIVQLNTSRVTKEQVEALQKALPNCTIDHDPFP